MYKSKDDFEARSRQAFLQGAPMSLADLRATVAAKMQGTSRRDALSAFDSVERLFGLELSTVLASPRPVRELLASKTAAQLRVSEKRYANIRSSISAALRSYADPIAQITARVPIAPEWAALLARIDGPTYQKALHRLACFCSHMEIKPQRVNRKILLGFFAAMLAEEVIKNPKQLLKHTIAHWNMCKQRTQGWPDFKLASPFGAKCHCFSAATISG